MQGGIGGPFASEHIPSKAIFSIASGILMLATAIPLAFAYYYSEVREHTILGFA